MGRQQPDFYELLGVRRDAKHNDIHLAYNRKMRAAKRDDAVPDLKYETKLREAFEVLSDLDRREAYDKSLVAAKLKPSFGRKGAVAAVFGIAAVAGGIYYFTIHKPAEEAARLPGKPREEIAASATTAVGRLESMDMNGQVKPAGLAFAVESGVMVTSCEHIAPNAQLSVNMNPRKVPARLVMTDEALGLCKLEVEGAGSWPLEVNSARVRGGDVVYGASVNAVGEVVLTEGRVKRVYTDPKGHLVVESTLPPEKAVDGAPLLDIYGRVVAVAAQAPGGPDRHVVLPAKWTDPPKPAATSPAAPASAEGQPSPSPEAPGPAGKLPEGLTPAPSMPNAPGSMTPDRIDRLHKAFRPPPNIPADQDP
jgi:hypothetical protein